ncbi:MAG: glycosyl hydrolase [Streptosporangiaceae bacterium]
MVAGVDALEVALQLGYGRGATFPSDSQQAAFLAAALPMLQGLSYVQRYAWFALPVCSAYGNTGLFGSGPAVTRVGEAYEAAP